jgi:hypothetical protein
MANQKGWFKRQAELAKLQYEQLPEWMKPKCTFVWGYGFRCELEENHDGNHRARYNDGPTGPDYVECLPAKGDT